MPVLQEWQGKADKKSDSSIVFAVDEKYELEGVQYESSSDSSYACITVPPVTNQPTPNESPSCSI